jgi:hypothetical protein
VKQKIVYNYRGLVERGTGGPGYDWREGYSETAPDGGILYPWMTKRECQADARAKDAQAVFMRESRPAPLTWTPETARARVGGTFGT